MKDKGISVSFRFDSRVCSLKPITSLHYEYGLRVGGFIFIWLWFVLDIGFYR